MRTRGHWTSGVVVAVTAFPVVPSRSVTVLGPAGQDGSSAAVTGGAKAARAAAVRGAGCVDPLPLPMASVSTPFPLGVGVTLVGMSLGHGALWDRSHVIARGVVGAVSEALDMSDEERKCTLCCEE